MKRLVVWIAVISIFLMAAPGDIYAWTDDAVATEQETSEQWDHTEWDVIDDNAESDDENRVSDDVDGEIWSAEDEEVEDGIYEDIYMEEDMEVTE